MATLIGRSVMVRADGSSSDGKIGRIIATRAIDGEPHFTVKLPSGRHTLPVKLCTLLRNR